MPVIETYEAKFPITPKEFLALPIQDRILTVANVIERNEKFFDMDSYTKWNYEAVGKTPEGENEYECYTTHCIAGLTCVLAGRCFSSGRGQDGSAYHLIASEILCISEDDANEMFYEFSATAAEAAEMLRHYAYTKQVVWCDPPFGSNRDLQAVE